MMFSKVIFVWCSILVSASYCFEIKHEMELEKHTEVNIESESARGRCGVIEEEKYHNIHSDNRGENSMNMNPLAPLPPEDDPSTKISITNDVKDVLPLHQTTERVTDKPTGRGARASNENWIKLPYPSQDDNQRDDILTTPQPDEDDIVKSKPVYPGQAVYQPEESRFSNFQDNIESGSARVRRGVIEEEKYYNMHSDNRGESIMNINPPAPWMPGPLPPEDDSSTKISITNDVKDVLPLYQTTERVTDKPTGRGARASNENWIKLPYLSQDDNQRDDILTPPQPLGDLINTRMPRVNFVTQNKPLETSESRNDKESIQRATRTDNIRTEFVRPDEDDRVKYKPVYPRQAVYQPEESRRFYDDRYRFTPDDLYRRDPYYDLYDRSRYYPGYVPTRIDRYDDSYDNYVPRKPKRIIYYAHLPEVVRTPPSVDLRYRYSMDPHRRYDEDYTRSGRYDYRFRNRYPYAPLRKEDRNYRDLAGAGTINEDKKVEEKVTPTPILPKKEDQYKPPTNNKNANNKNLINSHQYHESVDTYNDPLISKGFQNIVRPEDRYLRFEKPLFQSAIDDPYQRKY